MVHRKVTACPPLPGALVSYCWGSSMFHLQENFSESNLIIQKGLYVAMPVPTKFFPICSLCKSSPTCTSGLLGMVCFPYTFRF